MNGKGRLITRTELMELIRKNEWMEDTSFECVPRTEGGFCVEEHVWSMNAEHVRSTVAVDGEGVILSAGGYAAVEELQARGVLVRDE